MNKKYTFAELKRRIETKEITVSTIEEALVCLRFDRKHIEGEHIGFYLAGVEEGLIFIDILENDGEETLFIAADMVPKTKREMLKKYAELSTENN